MKRKKLPGTELVRASFEQSLSVSPDEQWVVFWEWVEPKAEFLAHSKPGDFELRLASLNLETGARVRHVLDSIPSSDIPAPGVGPWVDRAWSRLHFMFDPAGWGDGVFYIHPLVRRYRIAVDPGRPLLRVAPVPKGPLLCSDCPPSQELATRIGADRAKHLFSERSIAWRNGRFSEVMYQVDQKAGGIVRVFPDNRHELLVPNKPRRGMMTSFERLRVSPDERFLAYALRRKIEFVIPLPDRAADVFVMDLKTGKEKRIGTWGYVTNLIWSGDGQRLYFGAEGGRGHKSGIYVVDVAAMFRG